MNQKIVIVISCILLIGAIGYFQLESDTSPSPSGESPSLVQATKDAAPNTNIAPKKTSATKPAQPSLATKSAVDPGSAQPLNSDAIKDAGTASQSQQAQVVQGSSRKTGSGNTSPATSPTSNQDDQEMERAKTRFPLDRAGIPQAVRSVGPDIKDCYQEWLKLNPGIGGRMKVKITVTADPEDSSRGQVTGAEVLESEVKNAFIDGCVLNALSDLEFNAPPDGTMSFVYPFRFSAPDAGVIVDAGT